MSFLFRRPKSPFWWVSFKDPVTGKQTHRSTKIKAGTSAAHRQALEIASAHDKNAAISRSDAGAWDSWVPTFISARYASSPRSRQRNEIVWRTLRLFFTEMQVEYPIQLSRDHCYRFMEWRKAQKMFKGTGKLPISHNTALYELKVMRMILNEARKRGLIQSNPASDLGIKEEPPAEKGEMSDEHIARIRTYIRNLQDKASEIKSEAMAERAHFLHVSFEIALHQACRLQETYLPLSNVDTKKLTIRFLAKGNQFYTTALNPALVPLFEWLKQQGRTHTYKPQRKASLVWWNAFTELRQEDPSLANVSFHSLRVTGISRLEEAGVPEPVVMKLVNHSSTTIHRRYRRVSQKEFSVSWASMGAAYAPPSLRNQDSGPTNPEPPKESSGNHG
jgi:integrase